MPNLTTTTAGADLSACHLCLTKSPNLEFLDSGWRLVPLCPRCLPRILSASACSYCFQPFSTTATTLRCRRCSRRIHLRCAPILRGYAAPSDLLDPDRFDCTDCCPIIRPRPRSGAPEKWRAIVRETAAVTAKGAARAKTAEAAVATGKMHGVLSDEELALQLHLEMNGSRRTRNSSKRARCNDNSVIQKVDCVNHGFSTEKISVEGADRCSRSTLGAVIVREGQGSCCQSSAIEMGIEGFGKGDLVEVAANGDRENCDQSSSSIKVGCFEKVETNVKQHNGNRESSIVEVPVIEDQDHGRCDQSSSSVKLDEYDQKKVRKGSDLVEVLVTDLPKVYEESNLGQLNDTLVRSELRIHVSKDSVDSQQKRYEVRDRYMKKYRKRRRGSDLVDVHVNKGHGICDQCSSSVKFDCTEKVQNKVTKGCRNSNLVEKHLLNEIHGYMQSNPVEVSVSKNHGSHDQSSIKLRCTDNQKSVINAYSESNLVEVAVKEHEKILKGSSSIEVESNVTNYQGGMNGCINIGLVSLPIDEQGRFSESIDPISVSCQSIGKLNDTLVQSEFRVHNLDDSVEAHPNRCDVPDRYMKKYSKRRSQMKGIMDPKESRLVPCVQTCSSEMSRSLSSMHSSPHIRLPRHR